MLTYGDGFDIISTVADENTKKKVGKLKKVLTSDERYDSISNVAEKANEKIKNKKTLDK